MMATKARRTTKKRVPEKPLTRLRRSFIEARQLFQHFQSGRMRARGPDMELTGEAAKRLEQLEWIAGRLYRIQAAQRRLYLRGPRRPSSHPRWAKHQHLAGKEVELLTEAFYYFAWRFRQILKQDLKGAFSNFSPAGIRVVRNQLIEHPTTALASNFLYGADAQEGPRIKPFGTPNGGTRDRGLYVNAQEMLDALIPRLRRQLEGGA